MKQAQNGAKTRPEASRSMQEHFRGVNEVICDGFRRGNPRYARFGYGFEDLHNFVPKSMQEAVGGQSETVGHQGDDIWTTCFRFQPRFMVSSSWGPPFCLKHQIGVFLRFHRVFGCP